MKVINLFSGPGTGKSTTAAGLFYSMKSAGYRVELITEFAKDLVYQESFFRLGDQLMIFARQNHKLWVLKGKVDYVIVDSPLLLSNHYYTQNDCYNEELFKSLVLDTFSNYDNLNIYLQRNTENHPYQQYGRLQTLTEAVAIDSSIQQILNTNGVPYTTVEVSNSTVDTIFNKIKELDGTNK